MAEAASERGALPQAFGTSAQTIYQVPASGCNALTGGADLTFVANGFRYGTGTSAFPIIIGCPLNLPSGARIDKFEILAHDADDTNDVEASFVYCSSTVFSAGCTGIGFVGTSGTAASPFTGFLTADLSGFGFVVDKASTQYHVHVILEGPFDANAFRQVNVYYRLQVNTPPVIPTFLDVAPSHPYYQFIEALAAAGITGGCGGGNYCPSRPLTRGEMAVFLAKALGLHFPN